ncbi:MAG: 50S ribosomal protein L9 [Myxococcales bacterium]|nr:50S ribosomal protein L9 [Myxococcales bacterium]
MQVILREDVEHLGDVGDIVTVRPGYARNFLLPRGLAVLANERQVRRVEHEQRVIESRLAKLRAGAEAQAKQVNQIHLTIEKAAGENLKLFGSVTTMELEALLRAQGHEVSRRQIQLKDNIKTLGSHKVAVKLHRDVQATITVEVVPAPGSFVATEAADKADADDEYEAYEA